MKGRLARLHDPASANAVPNGIFMVGVEKASTSGHAQKGF